MTLFTPNIAKLRARAVRNVALCVIELQSVPRTLCPTQEAQLWRDKADRLRNAIWRADRFVERGNPEAARILLEQENNTP